MAEVTFGEWLKRRRNSLGLTQKQLALHINCSTSALRKFEGETRRPSAQMVAQIAEVFKIPIGERESFLRYARGDWQSAPSEGGEDSPWQDSMTTPPSNLPTLITSFIGREKERSDIIGLIAKYRLITLTGSGGVGKTRLAIKVGEEVLGNYPDGVWLVDLAPIFDSLLVARTAAIAVGLHDEPQRPIIDMLSDYLRKKEMLIILDNCEHLLDACVQFTDTLLKRCPNLKILSTSREVLSIFGEAVYPVPSLELPETQQLLEKFRETESVRLFEERAQLARMDFSLTIENVPSVSKICSRLDGIPLAIELAAARINVLSTEKIAERLQKSFDLLAMGNRTALLRHQTLQAAIDWSYDLLSLPEQTIFQRLSVFVDGWTFEAAESICSDASFQPETILALLTQLVNKSMVIVEEDQSKTRYGMLETLRQYANDKLVASGERDALRDRHLEYFLHLAETAAPYLIRPEQLEWLARLDADYQNIRAALKWALRKDSAEYSMRLCAALGPFWNVRTYWLEGTKWLRNALSKPSQNQVAAEQTARVRALYYDAHLSGELDDVERMTTSAALSLELAKMGSNRLDTAIAEFYVGIALKRHRNENQAVLIFQEILNEFRKLNVSYWEAQAYFWCGAILEDRGELTSLEYFSQSLSLARIAGERYTLALRLIGSARVLSKHADDAIKLIEEAHSLLEQVGSQYKKGNFLLAELEWLKGENEKAKKIYFEIEERYGLLGEKNSRSDAIAALGLLAMEQRQLSDAQNYIERAFAIAQELKDNIFLSKRQAELAKLHYLLGNMDKFKEKIHGSVSAAKDILPFWKINPLVIILSTIYSQQPEISTRVLGAIDAFFQKMGQRNFDPKPLERYYDRAESHTREVLGHAVFDSAFVKGQKISLDEALDLVLEAVGEWSADHRSGS